MGVFLLLGIIPGNGRKEAFHLDPYISLVVEELLVLSDCHVHYPSYMRAPVKVQPKLLQYVLDFPGISKLLKLHSTGAVKACPWCSITGKYSKSFRKTVYLDNRRYLESDNVLRNNENFTASSEYDHIIKPGTLSVEDLTFKRRQFYQQLPNENQRNFFTREHGVKGTYALMKLPYHWYHEHVKPDGMHAVFDVVEHILAWLIGTKGEEVLKLGESELRPGKRKHADNDICILMQREKTTGNSRCKLLRFPADCSGFRADLFVNPKVEVELRFDICLNFTCCNYVSVVFPVVVVVGFFFFLFF